MRPQYGCSAYNSNNSVKYIDHKTKMVVPALYCLPWACSSNIFWWFRLCCSWNRYGTTSKHSQSSQTRYKTRWLHKDGCGLFTATITHFLIYGASYIGTFHLLTPWHLRKDNALSPFFYYFNIFIFNSLLLLGSISHFRAMTTDPGAVPEGSLPLPKDFLKFTKNKKNIKKCERSGVYKPPRAHYDRGVSRQVVKMDHHCPWVNNCIGINNQKFFILFCMYVGLASFYILFIEIMYWINSCVHYSSNSSQLVTNVVSTINNNNTSQCGSIAPTSVIFLILLTVESVLFGLFTSCMFGDQIHSIASNKTYIDRLKDKRDGNSMNSGINNSNNSNKSKPDHSKKTNCLYKSIFVMNLREVVGDSSIFIWFLPILPYWNDRDELFGFCQPGSKLGRETKFNMLRNDNEELPDC